METKVWYPDVLLSSTQAETENGSAVLITGDGFVALPLTVPLTAIELDPIRPGAQVAPEPRVRVLPCPVMSAAVVPEPSSKDQAAGCASAATWGAERAEEKT